MKKSFLLLICTLLLANFLYAQPNLSGKKIYVNPGHGSYGHDDRPQSTIPYPILSGLGIPDTCGFFESNTNLHKCLYLGKKLEQYGAKVTYSHTECGPWPYEKENDTYPQYKFGVWQGNNIEKWNKWVVDSATWYRDFGTNDPFTYCKHPDIRKYNRIPALVGQEVGDSVVNGYNFDCFVSVHSNAPLTTDDQMANYPLFLYRGFNVDRPSNDANAAAKNNDLSYYSPGSYELADAAWKHCYELIEGVGSLRHPTKGETSSVDKKLIYGDLDYYYEKDKTYPDGLHVDQDTLEFAGKEYYSYLGVVRHMVPGFLAEGYHHSYGPARHRALNYDYCRMEGLAYFRGILDYFGLEGEKVGYILGVIKDNNTPAPDDEDYKYHPGSHDQWMPCNGAVVVLKKNGVEKESYTVDQNYNGIFAFFDLEPGTYTLESTFGDLEFSEQVVVRANETTYSRLYPKTTPAICAYNLEVEEGINFYTFSFDANSAATTAKIVFYNDSKQKIGEQSVSVVKGYNEITIPAINIPGKSGQSISWAVDLTGEAIAEFELLQSDASLDVYSTSQLFNAVNTNPMSENFGQIYVMHRANTNTSNATQAAESGLYVYDFGLTRQNNSAYKGGLTFGHPTRMSLDEEGHLYISDWSDPKSGIYVANTADLTQTFEQFFQGTRDANGVFTKSGKAVGASTTGNSIYGKGKDTKLYVFNEDQATGLPKNGMTIYNIGQNDGTILREWSTAPSATITCSGNISGNSALWGTSKGVFMSQHRDGYDNHASIHFYNTAGERVYMSPIRSNTDSAQSPIHGSYGGGFAVSPDEKMLIINDGKYNKQFLVFDITWNGETPTLTLSDTYSHGLGAIRQMNWDYAGNLVCSGDEGIHIFSVPTNNNNTIVPARQSFVRKDAEISSRRIWAYDLKRTLTREGYLFSFTATVDATEAELILKDNNGTVIKSVTLNNVTQGNNEMLLGYNEVPTTTEDISWEITLSAGEVAEQATLQELTSDMDKFYYYLAQDVKVNNNPYSDHFGKIYVLETYDGKNDGKKQHSKTQKAGIYVYDQNLNLENYARGYLPEGVDVKTFTTGHQYRVLHRLAIDPLTDQVAFIQSKTDQLWKANPDNLNAAAQNILSGKATDASSMCYDAAGNLFVFGYNSAEEKAIIYKKEVGSNNFNPFVEIYPWEYENERNSMAADGQGGLWVISQFSGNNYGNFFHVNQYGDVDFNIGTNGTTLTGKLLKTDMPENMPIIFNRGQLAYDAERKILAIGGDSKVTLYKVTYSPTTPTLEYWTSTSTIGNIDGIAFDYAGDLYVMSAATERFYKFAVPTQENTCTTPAPKSQKLWANPLILDDTKDNTKLLKESMSKSRNVYVFRTMVPGMYNTLCLPFALKELDGTCLEGAQALEYDKADVINEGEEIYLNFNNVSSLEAGKPYLIEPLESAEVLAFANVSVTTITGSGEDKPISGGDICFNGILTPKLLEAYDKSILFLVSSNRLAWANADAEMFGMRGYFYVPEGASRIKGRAHIQVKEPVATDLQQTHSQSIATKFIHDGVLYIQRDGVVYTVMGTKVQ